MRYSGEKIKQYSLYTLLTVVVIGLVGYHIFAWTQVAGFLGAFAKESSTAYIIKDNPQYKMENRHIQEASEASNVLLSPPTAISIPSIHLSLGVVISDQLSSTEWQISQTKANFADGTALPNMTSGNTVIFGHDTPQVFHSIHLLHAGDTIVVSTKSASYTYDVTKTQVIGPYDVAIMDPTTTPTLTLFTCDGWFSENRFAVFANLVHTSSLSSSQ